MKTYYIYKLAIKYWLEGECWSYSKYLATRFVTGYKFK